MNVTIRITRDIFNAMQKDFSRPHLFAYERVGFLFGKTEKSLNGFVVFPMRFEAIADENYIRDKYVGAKINSIAIRKALQTSMTNSESVFHVHQHCGNGLPGFSSVDIDSTKELIPSFCAVSSSNVHGSIVLSNDQATGMVWYPGCSEPVKATITIVGFPTTICIPKFGEKYE